MIIEASSSNSQQMIFGEYVSWYAGQLNTRVSLNTITEGRKKLFN